MRVPRYWMELKASGNSPSLRKRSCRSLSADSDGLSGQQQRDEQQLVVNGPQLYDSVKPSHFMQLQSRSGTTKNDKGRSVALQFMCCHQPEHLLSKLLSGGTQSPCLNILISSYILISDSSILFFQCFCFYVYLLREGQCTLITMPICINSVNVPDLVFICSPKQVDVNKKNKHF